jgi:hypothetical protein
MFVVKYVVLHQIKAIFFAHNQGSIANKAITTMIWANFLLYGSLLVTFLVACTPREKIWNPTIEGHCINVPACMTAGGALNVLSDIIVFIIPLTGVWKLQLPLKKKMGVALVFAVGILYELCSYFATVMEKD